MAEIDSANIAQIVDAESSDLVEEIRDKHRKWRIGVSSFIGMILSALSIGMFPQYQQPLSMLAVLLLFLTPIGIVADHIRKTTVLFYDFDETGEKRFEKLYEAVRALSSANRLWHVSAAGRVLDKKYQAGADQVIKRRLVSPKQGAPRYIKTNVSVMSLNAGAQTLYFFPDRLLVYEKRNVGAVDYKNVKLEIAVTNFIETEKPPRDARQIGKTWRYVNKKGGPDRRFKDNPQIPIMEYESVRFASNSGLNEEFLVSLVGSFRNIDEVFKEAKRRENT